MSSTIYFSNGEKIRVNGDVLEIHGKLQPGAPVVLEELAGREPQPVMVNPQQVTHVN